MAKLRGIPSTLRPEWHVVKISETVPSQIVLALTRNADSGFFNEYVVHQLQSSDQCVGSIHRLGLVDWLIGV